jgi:chitodextrinase
MERLWKFLLALGFVVVSLGAGLAQPNTTMYVSGRFLYSAVGEKVVFRGVNEMFIYSSDKQGSATLPQIAQTGANVVRICWNTSGSASDLDALLGNAITNKIIPIVQLDNITGNIYGMQTCLDYWKRADVMTAINKYKKWAIINIANEAGDNNTTDAQFQSVYIDAVSQLRTAGYTIPLIIDADGYGQNENAIINTWNSILQSDPQHNLVFSLHPYWKDSNTSALQTRFTNVFNAVVSNNIPFIIGEGPQQTGYDCSTQIPYSWVMQQCQANQIGWMVWTWGKVQDGTSGCGTTFDVTTNGNYGSWSNTWGQAIAVSDPNSIQNTSVRPPSIYGNTTPDTQAPTAPTNLVVSNITANGATLTWAASTDNVGVSSYNIYQGSILLTSSVTTSASLTGLSCNTAYAFTVKAKDAAGNLSAASNTASATTGTCPSGEVVYDDALNSNWEDWTWSAYRYFNNTTPVQQGTNSIRVDYGGYGGFSVRRGSAITPSANTVLKFWVYSSGANALKIYTQSADSGGESNVVNFTTDANQWKAITVTMAALGNPSAIRRINIQENAGNSPTVFYDYIRFDNSAPPADTQPPTAPTNLASSNITKTGLTLIWTSSTDNVGVSGYQVYQGSTLLNGSVSGTTYAVTGLTCGTQYNFSVTAKDAAGNTSPVSNMVMPTTSACSGGGTTTVMIYDEALATGWDDWSWSTTRNFVNTNPVKIGTKSLRLDYSAWSALSLRRAAGAVNTSSSTAIRFWIYTPVATTIKVYTSSSDNGGDASGYTFTTTANTWTEQTITNSQLGNPTQIQRIHVQNYTGNSATAYIDNLQLTSINGARIGTLEEPSLDLTVFPNPTASSVQVQYVADKTEPVQLQVIDVKGTVLQQKAEQAEAGANLFRLDLSQHDAGQYFIRLQSARGVHAKKVQVVR